MPLLAEKSSLIVYDEFPLKELTYLGFPVLS